jgi:hypothetical protein
MLAAAGSGLGILPKVLEVLGRDAQATLIFRIHFTIPSGSLAADLVLPVSMRAGSYKGKVVSRQAGTVVFPKTCYATGSGLDPAT